MYGITERRWSGKVIDDGLKFERGVRFYWNTDGLGVSVDGHKRARIMEPGSVIDAISHPNAVLVEHDAATTDGRCGRIESKEEDDGLQFYLVKNNILIFF